MMLKVLDMVEHIAAEQKIDQVTAIVLDIGELSSVVPMFIEDYFPLMIEDRPLFKDCELVIERTEGIAECVNCGEQYNVIENDGHCPCCNTFKKRVLQGRDFVIKEIQTPAPMQESAGSF
ncbi:MAG: hydrogenase maturation nickel metallochaperone HypA [Mogibacterium sp.]|nr:hydrogenase maturation nickel metallochaperone HypA [Mogibacterium sp.]